ncbi:MAG: hypothetical protein ACXAC8_05605 [Candidatus Hodarchaeales archaeon]|jgi:DNA-binding MarR family transcriptional regulator
MAILDSHEIMDSNNPAAKVSHLPKSAREIYSLLSINGMLKPREIGSHTSLSNRTIRYALKILVDDMLIRRVPDLHDLRSHFYTVN